MDEQEKLGAFRRSMTAQAEAEIARLEAEMDAVRSARAARAKARAEAGEDARIRAARAEAGRLTRQAGAQAAAEGRRGLLKQRETLTDGLFRAAREELLRFSASAEYEAFLQGCVRRLRAAVPQPEAVLLLRDADRARFGGALGWTGEIRADEGIALGGARALCEAAGVLADETLDARLEEQRVWFRAHTDLILTEGGAEA